MEDRQIIELYFERDEQAIRETDGKYGRLCRSIALKLLESREDCEECINDTYWNVWNRVPPTRPENFRAFLCKITRNLSLKRFDYNRAAKRNQDLCTSFSELEAVLPDERIRADEGEEEIGKAISDFLRTEPEKSRVVFLRRYWFFDSVSEIAKRYSFSESKVKSMLFRTRNRLREYLEKEGINL